MTTSTTRYLHKAAPGKPNHHKKKKGTPEYDAEHDPSGIDPDTKLPYGVKKTDRSPSGYVYKGIPVNKDGSLWKIGKKKPDTPVQTPIRRDADGNPRDPIRDPDTSQKPVEKPRPRARAGDVAKDEPAAEEKPKTTPPKVIDRAGITRIKYRQSGR